jgi:DNA-binding beta-propeller fold protein YncE
MGTTALSGAVALAQVSTNGFFNWETAPVHPLELSPEGAILAICNLPDNRLELFDVSGGKPVATTNVPVGLDPVTVRFRSATEAWVANYISDSISVIDLPSARIVTTFATANEPSDIVFAGTPERAFVSCGQPNLVQVFDPTTLQVITNLAIDGNRPRAMARSPDGKLVYVAIFESGNASTIIGRGISPGFPRPSAIEFPFAPSDGKDPPPNNATNFNPSLNPLLGTNAPPRVGLIVKKNALDRWMDDNQGDWTEFIRGTNAAFTGRTPGWNIPDHDLGVIDASDFSIRYATGLMNICMALAVNPASKRISVVGTDALNQLRFTPVLNGIFVRVELAQVEPLGSTGSVVDLNPHLDYSRSQVGELERQQSIGDPRGIVWTADGRTAFITGMGSDNLIIVDAQGNRSGTNSTINLDQGPTGLALDETRQRLYVYNRFAGSISTVDILSRTVVDSLRMWDPTPLVIKLGRPHLYSTHVTSGLGQAACASCHVDARFDRLAWDLGDPTDQMKLITNANFANFVPAITNNYHPMKGPMVTQTLQDIIGHEPFHWRGDRDGLEQFSSTFTNLQGAAGTLTINEMQELKDFLGTIHFPPNPFRQFDNSLSTNISLQGQSALGRGRLPAGTPLPNGNAQAGLIAFRETAGAGCIPCHTLPAGLGTDMHFNGAIWQQIPFGQNSAHHVAVIELQRSSELPFKVPQLRNLFDKLGMDLSDTNSRAGFGFSHDGSVDSLPRFVEDAFSVTNDQTIADLTAFLLSFTGSDLVPGSILDKNRSPGLSSLDTPASVGRQLTLSGPDRSPLLDRMISLALAGTSRVDLVVKGFEDNLQRGWFLDSSSGTFQSDRLAEVLSPDSLRALASKGSEQTYTLVPRGSGRRIGIDRDNDGYLDRDELDFGSDPANPLSLATNTPPRLGPIPDFTVLKGRLFTVTFTAVDSDIPVQVLTFSLGTNGPPGAQINSTNGTFMWTPAGPPGPLTNAITVTVTDNGKPNKSDSRTFTVIAVDLNMGSVQIGANGTTLAWPALPGVSYLLQYKNALSDSVWIDVPGNILSTNGIGSKTDLIASTNSTRFYRVLALP